jgi:catechol O-methyltransferase
MDLKRRIPLLRWSVWRMAGGAHNITTTGQIGDGREAAAVEYVLKNARAGDIDDVLATIDKFAYEKVEHRRAQGPPRIPVAGLRPGAGI